MLRQRRQANRIRFILYITISLDYISSACTQHRCRCLHYSKMMLRISILLLCVSVTVGGVSHVKVDTSLPGWAEKLDAQFVSWETLFFTDICVIARTLFPTPHSLAPLPSRCIFMPMAALPSLPIMLDEQVAPCRWWANPYKDFTSLRNPFNVASRLINRPNWNHTLCQVSCSGLTRGRRTVSAVCFHINIFYGGQIVVLIQHMLTWMKSFAVYLIWLTKNFPGYNLLKGLLLVPEF